MMKTPYLLFCVILLCACAPTVTWHGNSPSDRALASLSPSIDTREAVIAKLGPPTTAAPLSEKRWYYVSYAMKKHGPRDPKVQEERVLVVTFKDDGTLEGTQILAPQRPQIPYDPNATPARGTERTAWQEIVGNIGKLRPSGPKEN